MAGLRENDGHNSRETVDRACLGGDVWDGWSLGQRRGEALALVMCKAAQTVSGCLFQLPMSPVPTTSMPCDTAVATMLGEKALQSPGRALTLVVWRAAIARFSRWEWHRHI